MSIINGKTSSILSMSEIEDRLSNAENRTCASLFVPETRTLRKVMRKGRQRSLRPLPRPLYARSKLRRSSIRLAFDKANLFPLPMRPSGGLFIAHTRGRYYYKDGRVAHTYHTKKFNAYVWIAQVVALEACSAFARWGPATRWKAGSIQVVWRHTGGYGNIARNFLIEVDGEFFLHAKVGKRYRLFRGERDYVLHHLPEHLFISAVDAAIEFEKTGLGTWFPESVDEEVKRDFPGRGKFAKLHRRLVELERVRELHQLEGSVPWYQKGKYHRPDGPAVEE